VAPNLPFANHWRLPRLIFLAITANLYSIAAKGSLKNSSLSAERLILNE